MSVQRSVRPATAYLGLGANLGDPAATLSAVRRIFARTSGLEVSGASALYRTEPVAGPPGQPDYLNAVLQVRTVLGPRQLLELCRDLESRFGRRRQVRWGARTLDLDILLYDDLHLEEPDLTIPHPRLHLRRFVLEPLCELAPERVHPELGRSFRRLLAELPGTARVERLTDEW